MAEKVCNNCKTNHKSPESVPYIVYESSQAKNERIIKRLVIAILICTVFLFLSNLCWLYAWTQYDYYSEEVIVEQDAGDGGNANYIGNDGDIINGSTESDCSQEGED